MLNKITVKDVAESSELRKQTPFYLGKGFGKEVTVRRWLYDITDSEGRLWALGFGVSKPIPHKELHRNQEIYGEFESFSNSKSKYAGRISDKFTKEEFVKKIKDKIDYLQKLLETHQKEIERLTNLI